MCVSVCRCVTDILCVCVSACESVCESVLCEWVSEWQCV